MRIQAREKGQGVTDGAGGFNDSMDVTAVRVHGRRGRDGETGCMTRGEAILAQIM